MEKSENPENDGGYLLPQGSFDKSTFKMRYKPEPLSLESIGANPILEGLKGWSASFTWHFMPSWAIDAGRD